MEKSERFSEKIRAPWSDEKRQLWMVHIPTITVAIIAFIISYEALCSLASLVRMCPSFLLPICLDLTMAVVAMTATSAAMEGRVEPLARNSLWFFTALSIFAQERYAFRAEPEGLIFSPTDWRSYVDVFLIGLPPIVTLLLSHLSLRQIRATDSARQRSEKNERRIVEAIEAGKIPAPDKLNEEIKRQGSVAKAAEIFGISPSTAYRVRKMKSKKIVQLPA